MINANYVTDFQWLCGLAIIFWADTCVIPMSSCVTVLNG